MVSYQTQKQWDAYILTQKVKTQKQRQVYTNNTQKRIMRF